MNSKPIYSNDISLNCTHPPNSKQPHSLIQIPSFKWCSFLYKADYSAKMSTCNIYCTVRFLRYLGNVNCSTKPITHIFYKPIQDSNNRSKSNWLSPKGRNINFRLLIIFHFCERHFDLSTIHFLLRECHSGCEIFAIISPQTKDLGWINKEMNKDVGCFRVVLVEKGNKP